ncbi:MAG: dihydroorotase [Deltaproteobacteria bacterium]|nr:dihydroorotase [Deltaproteobacteria bacterium]
MDVVVEKGRVVSVEKNVRGTKDARVINAQGMWVVPGLIDMHVHLREPGFEHKETVATGSRSAASSGFTTILAMPNTNPVLDTAQSVRYVRGLGREADLCRVLSSGAITKGQLGEELAPMVELFEAGAVAFTDDGRPVTSAAMMRRALEYASHLGIVVISHAEDLTLSAGGHMHEGHVSCHMGFNGIPSAAEEVCVARDLILAELTRGRLHLAHLSSKGSVRMLKEAKARGLDVTGEVTPHHFSLSHEAVRGYDTHAKMNPPLREPEDVSALIAALEDGTIDAIATDHAPHSTLEKDLPFDEAAFGIIGLETAVPLTLALVQDERLSPLRAIALLSHGPAKCLGLPLGTLVPGSIADVTLIAPELEWTARRFSSRSQNSPFVGAKLRGKAVLTMVAGKVVYENIEGALA